PVRVGRGGEQQRDRGLHPSVAQEDRAGADPHRDGARARLLPRKDPELIDHPPAMPPPAAPSEGGRHPAPPVPNRPAPSGGSDQRERGGSISRHEQRSLFGEILDWMLAPLLLLWPMSVALTWLVAQGIANRPYDRELGQLAHSVARDVRNDP